MLIYQNNILLMKLLEKNNIKFEIQKKFLDCKYIKHLKFDFYLSENNICIEFDGKQHFKPIEFFGGIKTYNKQLIRDQIKNDFCKKNNINLIRIKYTDYQNLENILNEKLSVYYINDRNSVNK